MNSTMRSAAFALAALLTLGTGASAQQANMTFFVTSAGPSKGADLGGLAGADRQCQQLAQAVGREGFSMAEYRDTMRKQIGRYKLINEKIRKNVKVSEADVQSEYDRMTHTEGQDYEVHVRHILIAVPRNAPAAEVEKSRVKATGLSAEARKDGVDFADLARKRSEGSSSSDGGDLGFFKRGTMVPEFEKVAFGLKPGEVSEPVRTQFGWHVLKLEEIRTLGIKPLAELKPEIEDRLRRVQAERLTSQYMDQLRQAAAVEKKI